VLLRLLIVVFAGIVLTLPGEAQGTRRHTFFSRRTLRPERLRIRGASHGLSAAAYVLLLAGLIKFFPDHSLAAMRGLTISNGPERRCIVRARRRQILGGSGERTTLLIALFFPTLVIMTGEILTEATATLMSAAFLYLLVRFWEEPRWFHLVAVAIVIGMAALVRFNMALFGFVALAAIFLRKEAYLNGPLPS